MASTNKTPKLGLNQWAAGDSVLRTDFNADNAKIEAAIQWVKLKEVVTTAAVHTIDLDFSDLDLSPYRMVRLYYTMASKQGDSIRLRMNKVETNSYCHVPGSQKDSLITLSGTGNNHTSMGMIELWPLDNEIALYAHGIGKIITDYSACDFFAISEVCALTALQTLNFFLAVSTTILNAGATFSIYGLTK